MELSREELALIAAIRADRDSDVPRLVYADWLDENGRSERAEFIRVQCWLSANPATHPDWEAVWAREQELILNPLARVPQELTAPLEPQCWLPPTYIRGFPWIAWYNDVEWYNHNFDKLVEILPTDHIILEFAFDDSLPRLYQHPLAHELRGLWIQETCLRLESFECLCEAQSMQQLQYLSMCQLWDGRVQRNNFLWEYLTFNPVLPVLSFLQTSVMDFPGSLGTDFLNSPHRKSMAGLNSMYFDEIAGSNFCNHPAVSQLKYLLLTNQHCTDATAQILLETPYLNNVQLLAYPYMSEINSINPELIVALRKKYGDRIDFEVTGTEQEASNNRHIFRVVSGRRLGHIPFKVPLIAT